MSPETNRPTPGPGPHTYMPGIVKKLWPWPTLAAVLAVIGGLLGYNSNWNIVTALAAFPVMMPLGRLLGSKRTQDGSHLAGGVWMFLAMSIFSGALVAASFYSGAYLAVVAASTAMVIFTAFYMWGCDVNARTKARKAAGEV